jgi:protein arginine kinase activator
MLCDNCGKNEAEITLKQMADGTAKQLNLCRECAEEMGCIPSGVPSITISFLISEEPVKRKARRSIPRRKESQFDALACPSCGMKFNEYRDENLLGCPQCYEAFRFPLGAFLHKTQGAESHWVGATSEMLGEIAVEEGLALSEADEKRKSELEENIARLRLEMNEAISAEDYERAAELRDLIGPLVNGDGKNDR